MLRAVLARFSPYNESVSADEATVKRNDVNSATRTPSRGALASSVWNACRKLYEGFADGIIIKDTASFNVDSLEM